MTVCCVTDPMSTVVGSTFISSISECQSRKLVLVEETEFFGAVSVRHVNAGSKSLWRFCERDRTQPWQSTLSEYPDKVFLPVSQIQPPRPPYQPWTHLPPPLPRNLCHRIQWGHSWEPMCVAPVWWNQSSFLPSKPMYSLFNFFNHMGNNDNTGSCSKNIDVLYWFHVIAFYQICRVWVGIDSL